jgi:D-amino-acid dehydrogenase
MDSGRDNKILVIGAGVLGITTSYYLAGAGCKVTCLEKNKLAHGTSFINGGLICPSATKPWSNCSLWRDCANKLIYGNGLRGGLDNKLSPIKIHKSTLMDFKFWRFMPHFLRNTTVSRTMRNTASIDAISSYGSRCIGKLLADNQNNLSIDNSSKGTLSLTTCIDPGITKINCSLIAGLLEIEPCLKNSTALTRIVDYKVYPDDTNGNIYKFCHQLANLTTTRYPGTKFITGQAITEFIVQNNHWLIDDKKIIGVKTKQGDIFYADHIVVCAGVGTSELLSKLNVYVPVYPVKGYIVSGILSRQLNYNILDDRNKLYITCLGKDNLRISGFAIFDTLNPEINKLYCKQLLQQTKALLPGITISGVSYHTGFRPMTPDDVPLIGKIKGFSNLWVNAGHGSKGWTQSCGSSKLLSDLLVGNDPEIDPAPYNPNRFNFF